LKCKAFFIDYLRKLYAQKYFNHIKKALNYII